MMVFWTTVAILTLVSLAVIVQGLLRAPVRLPVLLVTMLAVPTLTFLGYFHWGASTQVAIAKHTQHKTQQLRAQIKQLGSRRNIIQVLETQVKAHPQSAKGWYLLGKLYLGQGDFKTAQARLEQAYRRAPQDSEVMIALAEARFQQQGQTLDPTARRLVDTLLKSQPKHSNALNLLALDAFHRKQYEAAVHFWEQILPQFAPGSEDSQKLLSMIASAQKLQQAGVKP